MNVKPRKSSLDAVVANLVSGRLAAIRRRAGASASRRTLYRIVTAPRATSSKRMPVECRASMDALRERLEEVRALREVRAELGL